MIHLVTGATGTIGSRVVDRLLARRQPTRVFVRDADKARNRFGEGVEIVVGDLGDAASLAAALRGVTTLFLVNGGADLDRRDELAAGVARATGVQRIVKLSSLGARRSGEATAVALWHARGEAAIRASGVPFTFLQSVGFMSNALAWAPAVKSEGLIRASTGDGKIAMIHPDDIAAVASEVLVAGTHVGEALALTGPAALTYAEMTEKIGAAIDRSLRFEAISDEAAREALLGRGMPAPVVEALVTLWREVREGRIDLVTNDVERVTGCRPTTFDRWALDNAKAFR